MKRSRIVFLGVGLGMLVSIQALGTSLLLSRDGARIQWPEPGSRHGRDFISSGDVWMAPGPGAIASLVVEARPGFSPEASPIVFPAERAIVRYQGRALFALPTWTARISLPFDGDWALKLAATTSDGRRVESSAKKAIIADRGGAAEGGFASWSAPHLLAIGSILLACLLVAYFARRGGPPWLDKAAPFIASAMWLNELAYQSYWIAVGGWSQSVSLMLQMCGLSIILSPLCLFLAEGPWRRYLADILYFWGIGGALQAILTPDIGFSGFPSYRYFSFFISHGLILVAMVALVASGSIRISLRSLSRCVLVSNLVIVPIYLIDRLLALFPPYAPGNYFAIGYPPPTGSPIDLLVRLFGPSPRYVIGLEIMAVLVFFLLWLPWGMRSWARSRDRALGRAA
jgi:hypothetical integral membrane protein (TIGR02206 family)